MQPENRTSRRRFLRAATAAVTASAIPSWFLDASPSRAAASTPKSASPNDRPAVALIGCGGRGVGILREAVPFGKVVALCDVDESHVGKVKEEYPDAQTYHDFRAVMDRKDVDVVLCGTVDHWHTLVSIAAMRAGKDVYCEKPLTMTIDEGKRLIDVSRETKRVLQTGSQQRSDARFRLVCELVRNGRIGKLKSIDTVLPVGPREGPFHTSPVPKGLDWNLWLGPRPKVDYIKERCHFFFRYWLDYSGGTMTDWGAHHNDIALWGMGLERGGPLTVEGKELVEMVPDGYTTASEYVVKYTYANGVTHTCRSTAASDITGKAADDKGRRHGVQFEGSDGWIFVTRGRAEASRPEFLTDPLPSGATKLYVSDDHMGNFFDCVRSRKQPICEPEIGHRSASVCHLGVIALRLGRKLKWNPVKEQFVGDKEANTYLRRDPRGPWTYDSV